MDVDNRRPLSPRMLAALSQVPEVAKQVRQVANAIRRDARRLAPKETGNLRRNIQVERVYDRQSGLVEFYVGWGGKAWYGWMVEAGGEDHQPQPHLVPAAIKNGAVAPEGGG
ncbi:HK97-gp10 family putative phage morphogenesis protein [Micromonospora peucetia]|uniref:HK97 gp10 family phage protein n=1 Tax=Micromonospora peucetia TaxID=47871 RepID=A0ABZ1EJV4_9ACTN|nr:HK97-gp10 family putative phage morphogenesis protein [Micromonospora peucetia]WSA34553.1 HK97 gp10 family phage protein [Micromonospora peucetia]